jgi:hypothetical protein
LPPQAAKEHKLLLPYLYLRQGDVKSAKQVNNSIIDANSNTPLGIRAKLGNFFISLYIENDPMAAASILKEVQSMPDLLTSTEITGAENALKTYVDPNTGKMPNYGSEKYSDGGTSSVPEVDGIKGNYPNPFNPSTQIRFAVKRGGLVSLKVFDLLGREVAVLVNEVKSPGTYNVIWNASQVASGIYFARFELAGRMAIHKLLYLK